VFFTRRPTKLGLHFSDFSMIFYGFYKNQENCFTIEVFCFQPGPWKFPCPHTYALGLQHRPRKETNLCNGVLGEMASAACRNSARPAAGTAREECGEGLGCARGLFWD
jgi:hypothetical protein